MEKKLNSDPIRMYLAQMAEIPLLTRAEEISLAKKIEVTRKRFRRTLLRVRLRPAGHGRHADAGLSRANCRSIARSRSR